jgi:hypothetical protein
LTDTQTGPAWTAEDDGAYLRAQIALGIVKLPPKAKPPSGNGRLGEAGIKLPERERPLSGESLQDMTRRKEQQRKAELRQDWIDHYYHEIDAAYNRYIHIKGRNLQCIAELQGSGG